MSGPTTWLMFATPVRGLSEIWGLFIQICEILSQQWNCIFSLLDVAIFFVPVLFQTSSIIFYVSKFFRFTLENSEPSSGVEPGSFPSIVQCSSTALAICLRLFNSLFLRFIFLLMWFGSFIELTAWVGLNATIGSTM